MSQLGMYHTIAELGGPDHGLERLAKRHKQNLEIWHEETGQLDDGWRERVEERYGDRADELEAEYSD